MAKISIMGETTHSKDVIAINLLNLIRGRLMTIKEEYVKIDIELDRLQKKYQLTNDQFLQQWQSGSLGDEEEFFVWESSLKVRHNLTEEEEVYRDIL